MHLLVTASATLEEAAAAVDLGQSPADIVVLSFSDTDLSALAVAWCRDQHALPSLRLASLKQLRHPMSVDLYADSVLAKAQLVVVRCLGGLDYWRYGFERLGQIARENGVLVAALPGDDRDDPRLAAISTVPPHALALLDAYFRAGGADNLGQTLKLVTTLTAGHRSQPTSACTARMDTDPGFAPPQLLPACVGMAADGTVVDIETIATASSDRATALVVCYRASLLAADTQPIEALMAALQQRGLAAIALAVSSLKDPAAMPAIARAIDARRPVIIVNATAFSGLREDDTSVLDAADAPVLQVALAGTSREAWAASDRGLGAADLVMNVVLPELDGRIFARAISFKTARTIDTRLEYACQMHEPLPDRIAFVADLAAAWITLARKPAAERRVTIMLSDYPARGGRTGYAVGLDTPASILEIARWLAEAGYDVGSAAPTAADIAALLAAHAARQKAPRGDCDMAPAPQALTVCLDDYIAWLSRLPAELQSAIDAAWGPPGADPAFDDGGFSVPCIAAGNLTVLVQPDRGSHADRRSGYHDTTVPPRHAYVALYAALRQRERIDAIVHLGTHGTLEWLPGKALALSAACWPEAVLGPVPVIYPFIVNNPGEAMPAKRRIAAVTIGHMTPPLMEAGLDGALAGLEALIEEYAAAELSDPRRARLIEREVLAEAERHGLAADCGIVSSDAHRTAIARLDARLCDIKELSIRDGLHVLGRRQPPPSETALAEAIVVASGLAVPPPASVEGSTRPANPGTREIALVTRRIADCADAERYALLAALDGRRIAPGPAGAPTRGRLDVLPTGRNMTTLDPRAIPTRTAATIGAAAAEEVVRRHLQDHGEFPRNIVVDLWASPQLRTGGDDIAGVLAYLGARPQWDHGSSRLVGVEAIPLPKLDRPRIDVTLRMSGLFRDLFETQVALIAAAIRLVANLDEPEEWNPLAAARRRGEDARRLFGGAPGSHGAGTADLALDGDWLNRDTLGTAYLDATSHAYDAGGDGERAADAFRGRVAVAEALVHTQDDRERDLLDGDGVADFVGGFAAAASLLGAAPALYHLDTSEPGLARVRTLDHEIGRIVRGRLTNRRWLDAMARHGHAGVAEIAQGVDALFAFACTTDAVPGHLIDLVHAALIADRERAEALRGANPAAATAIAVRLAEAIARGVWTPHRNAVHTELEALSRPHIEAAQ